MTNADDVVKKGLQSHIKMCEVLLEDIEGDNQEMAKQHAFIILKCIAMSMKHLAFTLPISVLK